MPSTPQIAALRRATWRKSSRSGDLGACVEMAAAGPVVGVRDSKDPIGPVLVFPARAWTAFAAAPPVPGD